MSSKKTVKIFLASSNELKEDRDSFEIAIRRKYEIWHREQKPYLDLQIWETVSEAMSETRSQDEYNKKIKDSDIFILLLWTKAGKFSIEEFELAKRLFVSIGKPKIIVYQKKARHITDSLRDFLNQFHLESKEYFHGMYGDFSELHVKFQHELDLYFLENYPPSKRQVETKDSKFLKLFKIISKALLIACFASIIFEVKNGKYDIYDGRAFWGLTLYFILSIAFYKVAYYILLGIIRMFGVIIAYKLATTTKEKITKIGQSGLGVGHFYQTFSILLKSPDVNFNSVLQYLENEGVKTKVKEERSNSLCEFAVITLFVAITFYVKEIHYVSEYAFGALFVVLIIMAFFISTSGLINLISLEYLEAVTKNHKESIN